MGLDTYAATPPDGGELSEGDIKAFREADIQLCGGVFSGNSGSFRGKVYDLLILQVTGVSLYQEWIPPDAVREMARAFDESDPEAVAQQMQGTGRRHGWSAAEIIELRKFFRVCAERNLGLVNWW